MAKESVIDSGKVYAIWRESTGWGDLAFEVEPYDGDFKGISYAVSALRGHRIKGKIGKKTDRGFTFTADKTSVFPGVWEFVELTYEGMKAGEYGTIIGRDKLLAQVSNTEELQDWYRRNFPL